MKTLYIHAGTPKTGTTAIQQFLHLNREQLAKDSYVYKPMIYNDYSRLTHLEDPNGNIYVEEATGHPSSYRNGFFLHGKAYGDYREENRKRLAEGLSYVNTWFEEGENAILTDEHIWCDYTLWDYPKRIRAFAEQNGITIRFVVFIRPQYDYADSHYREVVKAHYQSFTFQEYVGQRKLMSEILCLNYIDRVRRICEDFGKENLILIPYEPAVWKNKNDTIFSVFLRSIGILDAAPYVIPPRDVNESLSYNQTEVFRTANRLIDTKDPYGEKFRLFLKRAGLECSAIRPDKKKYSFLTKEEKKAFMEQYEAGNRELAREFFGREELFRNAEDILSEKWEPDTAAMQEETLLFLTSAIKEMHREIQRLKEENAMLSAHSLGNKVRRFIDRHKKKD